MAREIFMKRFFYALPIIALTFSTQATSAMQWNVEASAKLKNMPLEAIYDSTQKIEQLLQEGADPDVLIFPNLKETLLHNAAEYESCSALVELLLRYGASYHQKNAFFRTPLYIACVTGASKNVGLLLQAGASIKDMCEDNKSDSIESALAALLYLARIAKMENGEMPWGYLKVAKLLLDAEGDTINPGNGLIWHKHTNAELARRLELPEFDLLFRKNVAKKLYQELRAFPQNNYIKCLPNELVQEVTLFATNEEYETKAIMKPMENS